MEFVATLDAQAKKVQARAGNDAGFAKLTVNQIRYLDAIAGLGEPTISEIAEKMEITKASVTIGINKLVEMGFVTKNQSEEDKRVFRVKLTGPSQQLVEARRQALKEYVEFIRAALSVEEVAQFETILIKLTRLFLNNAGSTL